MPLVELVPVLVEPRLARPRGRSFRAAPSARPFVREVVADQERGFGMENKYDPSYRPLDTTRREFVQHSLAAAGSVWASSALPLHAETAAL
jgi:hypothetical protein